ncbi:MAG TPA: S24 family peptidase [Streptosporangiaceae bacterium]|nr:S24 family peptidase [Streptosporangiaceae bacterium]
MTEALDRLYDAMAEESPLNRLTPFVGSGVSLAATGNPRAGWAGLLLDGIEVCGRLIPDLPPGWADQRQANLRNADVKAFIALAEDIVPRLREISGDREVGSWIKRAIGGLHPGPEGHELIKAVRGLGDFIVTTNYDTLIETMDPPLESCTWTDEEYKKAIRASTMVVHLHGVTGKPESIILGGSDYERLRTNEIVQNTNKGIFTAYRFLFIGCGDGLKDPNIGPLMTFLEKLKPEIDDEHYLLVRGSQLRQFRLNWRHSRLIAPVAYGDEFSELRPFLENLARGERVEISQDPEFYERRAASKPASLLDLRRTAQEKLQGAFDVFDGAAPAMRDVTLHSTMPPEIGSWDPDVQEPVHEQRAAALTDAVARLESCLESLVPAFQTAEIAVWPFALPKFAGLAVWVTPVAEGVSRLEDVSRDLLGKVTRARDVLQVYSDVYDGYRAPYKALKRSHENVERAAKIASSLKAGLSRSRHDQASAPSGAARPEADRPQPQAPPAEQAEAGQDDPSAQGEPPTSEAGPDSPYTWDGSFPENDAMPEPESRVVPLFEAVGAGNPMAANETPIGYLALPAELVKGEEVFMVVVTGESMAGEDGVLEGDYLIVDSGSQPENGDMVVAFIADSGAIVKRIWYEGTSVRLTSSSPGYKPRRFTSDEEIVIHGKVTGVVRPQVARASRRRRPSS